LYIPDPKLHDFNCLALNGLIYEKFIAFSEIIEIDPRASFMLGKHYIPELHSAYEFKTKISMTYKCVFCD
jgi:hypothetical protein